jgi:hypothetical protein
MTVGYVSVVLYAIVGRVNARVLWVTLLRHLDVKVRVDLLLRFVRECVW